MKKAIKFSLVFRDMWQSAGKYVPTVDQLTRVAPAIIEMGCFARVETNGGGFEQVNLLFGENPNKAVREWTKPFHEAGIQTHMLDRALNGLRMSPVPDDVRQLFYKVKKAQGTDIARTFCGLNDVRNIAPSIKYAKAAGMISQCSLCITHSPVHTVEYYTKMAYELIELGADEICIKDMAGIGRPRTLGNIVANIKKKYPEIPVQYHSHAGPGFNVASILEVCEAGCDYIDVHGAAVVGYGSCRLADRTGHAERRGLRRARNQYGGLHACACYDPRVYGRLLGLLYQSEEPLDELFAHRSGSAGWHDGQLDGRPGEKLGDYQQEQRQEQSPVDVARSAVDQAVQ